MRIPKQIKVGGHIIKIDMAKKLEVCGEFIRRKNLLRLDVDLPQSQKEVTFFHELFHAINVQFGESNTEHALLDSFAEQLYQVLKDNKLLR